MKKLIVMAVVALMATMSANAQQMFLKPMVGGTLATVTGDGTDGYKMKFGIVGGAEFGYYVMEPLAITAGALVSMQGAAMKDDYLPGYTDASSSLTYLNIPILANYYVAPGLALKAGVQPGFLLSRKYKYTVNGHDHEFTDKDGLNTFDFSIPLGISYEISDFVIDARYNLGLTNIIDNDNTDSSQKNSVIMLTLGYKIPF